MTIRVLVVDDDFRVAGLHASYVGSVPDFEVVGSAHTAADALRLAEELAPDLVLLDEYLPDGSGSALVGRLGAAVIMVSAAADAGVVRRAVAAGALNYVLKPFPPSELADRLQAFRRFWLMLEAGTHVDQTAVDRALQAVRSGDSPVATVRKGRSPVTSESIADVLRRAREAVTALEVAEATGVSRATAQRYLSDLARDGRVRLTLRYGTTGRPEHRFEWVG
ncbi:response regulator [Nocardioides sp. CER19]|uniref:response regulator n=1 Tax=Nocardioides sp. CER19 TaxID=3038538 RepID=UPI00244BA5E2|nr:response regulator [Nocardioides sp. CER19]MDH2415439.1 response regulator [Nocardioides sp. CER19]